MSDERKSFQIGRTPITIFPDKVCIGTHVIEREELQQILKDQDNLQPIDIQFKWEQYFEADDSWEALYVSIDNSFWRMAQPKFHCEDEERIRKIINEDKKHWKEVFK